jgi:hypothetical protein
MKWNKVELYTKCPGITVLIPRLTRRTPEVTFELDV